MANEKQAYTALTTIDYDNKRYTEGKTLQLDDETAAHLLEIGAVAKRSAAKPDKPDGSDPVDWSKKTIAEISEHLEQKKVDFDPKAKKDELVALAAANP